MGREDVAAAGRGQLTESGTGGGGTTAGVARAVVAARYGGFSTLPAALLISPLVFHKTLPVFVLPLGASLLLLAAGLRWRSRALLAVPLIILWTLSTPAISDPLMHTLEDRYRPCGVEQCPQADAVFVFGGMLGPREQPGGELEWNDAAARFDRGLALYLTGRAHILVLSSGERQDTDEIDEGERLKALAVRRGVAPRDIIVTQDTINTAAEAEALVKLADQKHWKRVLAVTSAYHMPRAMLLLRHCPAQVTPVPVGYQTRDLNKRSKPRLPEYFLPGAEALFQSERALREYLGMLFYRVVRG